MDAAHIANVQGPDTGNYLKVNAFADGKIEVINERNSVKKDYAAK